MATGKTKSIKSSTVKIPAVKKSVSEKKPTSQEKLSEGFETIISMLIDGATYRMIAEKFKVPLSTLHNFLSSDEHSARTQTALEISSSSFADKAEEHLKSIKSKATNADVSRERELAHHYRWKASKRNPKKYGDKVDLTSDHKPIQNPLSGLSYEELYALKHGTKPE